MSNTIFSDFSRTFTAHPISKDVATVNDAQAIRESLINLLLTSPNERPYSDIGAGIRQLLFEPMVVETTYRMKNLIESTIYSYEPRIDVLKVDVIAEDDTNSYLISLTFTPLNTTEQFTFKVSLKRLR